MADPLVRRTSQLWKYIINQGNVVIIQSREKSFKKMGMLLSEFDVLVIFLACFEGWSGVLSETFRQLNSLHGFHISAKIP